MKTVITKFLTAVCAVSLLATASAQTADNSDNNMPPPPDAGDNPPTMGAPPDDAGAGDNSSTASAPAQHVSVVGTATPASAETYASQFTPPAESKGTNSDSLRLNFRNAPLEMVLNYLSDAAGFIIVLDTQVHGNVSVISAKPMTKDEAVDLLNSVLDRNGYAAIRDGRTLTIVDKDSAKTRDIPVKVSNDPNQIPKNDEIVTQIIPIRFVEATDLVKDLSSFVSSSATIVANEAGNSIVITDTQSNIHHLVEIIKAIDSSAEGETEIRVFHLDHASPADVASELSQIFPSSSSSGTSGGAQSPIRFGGGGGPGGFFARMMAGNASSGNSSSSNSRVQKQSQVVAVADSRTSSVIVTASKDLMQEIAGMMTQLDVSSTRDQKVYVFHMDNGDPQQAVQVLQSMFQTSTTSRSGSSSSSSSQNSPLMERVIQNASSSSSSVSGSTSSSGFGSSSSRSGGSGQSF